MSKKKINEEFLQSLFAKGTVSNDVRDYGNDPFFVKKAEETKKIVDRIGIPPALLPKK